MFRSLFRLLRGALPLDPARTVTLGRVYIYSADDGFIDLGEMREKRTSPSSDASALREVWEAVGDDLRTAMDELDEELAHAHHES